MSTKELIKRLRGILLFGIFYLVTFFFIESRNVPIHIIHTKFDDYIPFCEYFIIPYVLWYLYVAGTVLYLGLTDKSGKEYYRLIINMAFWYDHFCNCFFSLPKWSGFKTSICI